MAKSKGFGGLFMGNLFAYQETDPKKMKIKAAAENFEYVIGPENEFYLDNLANEASTVVFAYGNIAVTEWGGKPKNDIARKHAKKVFDDMKKKKEKVYAFEITKSKNPSHPLYLQNLATNPLKELTSVPIVEFPVPSLTCLEPVPYPSLTCVLPTPYPPLTHPLPVPYRPFTCPLPNPYMSLPIWPP